MLHSFALFNFGKCWKYVTDSILVQHNEYMHIALFMKYRWYAWELRKLLYDHKKGQLNSSEMAKNCKFGTSFASEILISVWQKSPQDIRYNFWHQKVRVLVFQILHDNDLNRN